MNLSFENIEYLAALLVFIPVVLFFVLALRWKRKVKSALGDSHLVEELTKNYSHKRYRIKFWIVAIALLLSVLTYAGLRTTVAEKDEQRAGIDVMLALDVSRSMWAEDVKPSRLEQSKILFNDLLERLDNNRIGLVIFAGKAYLQMPLTTDLAAAKMFLQDASPYNIPIQGTNINEALSLCDNALDVKEKKHKVIVLISDGENSLEQESSIEKQLRERGVLVITIGVGTQKGAPILEPGNKQYKRDASGRFVVTKLSEAGLKKIANVTGGAYYHLENNTAIVNDILTQINEMDKKMIGGFNSRVYWSLAPILLSLAIIFLVFELFISERKKSK